MNYHKLVLEIYPAAELIYYDLRRRHIRTRLNLIKSYGMTIGCSIGDDPSSAWEDAWNKHQKNILEILSK